MIGCISTNFVVLLAIVNDGFVLMEGHQPEGDSGTIMMHTQDSKHQQSTIMVVADNELPVALMAALPNTAIRKTTTDALQTSPSADAVIGTDCNTIGELFRTIHAQSDYPLRPLTVVYGTPTQHCDLDDNLIDGWITPPDVARQLNSLLRLRQQALEIHAAKQTLNDKIAELELEMQNQRRLHNNVEVIKNAIVRNVSHELKTPLLQVKSAVSLLAEDVQDKKLIEYATGATARLETLVRNITMLGASLSTNMSPVVVRDAVEYARRNLRRVWESRDHTERIKIMIEPDLPPVLADKQGLSTIIQLLIDNALKFSKDTVEVYAKRSGDHIVIGVKDYGIGIAQDQVDAIFDSFYQVDGSSTRRYGGLGVGLAIVKLILDYHSSTISVESELDKGSDFSFRLPIAEL